MTSSNRTRNRAQRGMTLIETLVAVVVFTVVFLAALGLYQAANRAYMTTDAATIQQQNARFALDRMVETLRDAGANYNTTGNTSIPDEQLEGAWESAVFVRADYDNQRETSLQTTSRPYVTTGNDEIVGYVLRKPGMNSVTISVKTDLTPSTGRDANRSGSTITNEETVNIAVAANTLAGQTSPPYELTRVTFNTAGAPVYQVIAQNVFRLSFNYKDAGGAEIIDFDTAVGSADAERATRANVRRIGINLITMADRPDFGWNDPRAYTVDAFGHTAPAAAAIARNRRKFDLSEEVMGVSLGRKGARHNTTPKVTINPPATLTVCSGHHLSFYLSWPATTTPGVATYRVHVTAASPVVNEYINVPALEYRYKQPDPTLQAYSFEVAGIAGASAGAYTAPIVKTATHEPVPQSVPSAPATMAVAGRNAGSNSMLVRWPAVARNTDAISTPTCTTTGGGTARPDALGWGSEAVDLKEYQVHRRLAPAQATGSFTPASSNRIDQQQWGDLQNTTPSANTFTDNTAAPCGQYWYRIKAYDSDGRSDLVNNPDGSPAMAAVASYIPAGGVTPATPLAPNLVSMAAAGGNYVFTIDWPHVVRDSTGARAATAHYEILREQKIGSGAWGTPPLTSVHVYETNTLSQAMPATDLLSGQAIEYRYSVRAVYDCTALGDANREATGPPLTIVCLPPAGNSLSITTPAGGTAVSRPYETGFTPTLAFVGGAWTGANVQIVSPAGTIVYDETDNTAPFTFGFWDASAYPDGTYTVRATGFAGTCRSLPVTRTVVLETGTCGLTLVDPFLFPDTGNPDDRRRQLEFRLQNTCDASAITIDGLNLSWTNGPTGTLINTVNYNGVDNTTGLTADSGVAFALSSTITIPAGTTSNLFRIVYSIQHVDGATRWTSIIARTTSPAQNDETLTSPIAPIAH